MNSLAQPAKWEKYFWPLFAASFFLAAWYVSVKWTANKGISVAAGCRAWHAAELVRKGVLWHYVLDSLRRVASGYVAAVILGIPAGLLLGRYPAAGSVVNPTIQILRPISPIAWIPVSIVWFGVGDMAAISPGFPGVVLPGRGRFHERGAQCSLHV